MKFENALIVGSGPGLSASLARLFAANDIDVSLAARSTAKLIELCEETGATAVQCDASDEKDVERLFKTLAAQGKLPDLVVYNAGGYTRGPVTDLDLNAVRDTLKSTAFGALVVAQQAAKVMLDKGRGALLFTGASAGVKGYAQSAPFAMGKFALRGLCQSLARELAPSNIHVAHFVIDGCIYQPERGSPFDDLDTTLHAEEIAKTYFEIAKQDRSAWTWEVELRPFSENF
ncbi:SDR family NAD(P)-dependent oxidoreductase [Parasphingorhabdus sp.]|jgi:NAD(P)-dependent dehydrogenase (short-subunit alcohol dehydrogenase family)|uniref:SDR family NAD(P)-dependent oxidoreductase n=1 Tax=Parasphingorhabdus sp. TaxID=2709688 RepID=UPI003D27D963